jgi:hypothetical protein
MDYAWEYRSVAVQHELKFAELPDQINLGNYSYENFHKEAVLELIGNTLGRISVVEFLLTTVLNYVKRDLYQDWHISHLWNTQSLIPS